MFTELQSKVYSYIMSDVVRKENFTDTEICCIDDNEEADDRAVDIISEMSDEDCRQYLKSEGEL